MMMFATFAKGRDRRAQRSEFKERFRSRISSGGIGETEDLEKRFVAAFCAVVVGVVGGVVLAAQI